MAGLSDQHPEFAISLLGADPNWDLYVREDQCVVIWPVGEPLVCRVSGKVTKVPRHGFLISRLCPIRGRGDGLFAFIDITVAFLDRALSESEANLPTDRHTFWVARPRGLSLDLARFYVMTLWREFEQQLPHYRLAIHSNFCSLLYHLLREPRTLSGLDPDAIKYFERVSAETKVYALIARLRREYAQPWKLHDLCREAGVNRTTLNRVFRHATGYPPLAFIRQLRIQRAQELLRTSDTSVGDIASQVGYDDERRFYRLFRSWTGLTPGQFRSSDSI